MYGTARYFVLLAVGLKIGEGLYPRKVGDHPANSLSEGVSSALNSVS